MKLQGILDSFAGRRVLVVGDLMLDEYLFGTATRISPEAPVMVVRQVASRRVPGGAANVARNIQAMGGKATLIGIVGDDDAGRQLDSSLAESGLPDARLTIDATRQTTRKTRVVADHSHQVLRIDFEEDRELGSTVEARLIESIREASNDVDAIVASDYLKGALTTIVCEALLARAKDRSIPLVVNPKPRSLGQYRGANLVSLNRSEASETLGLLRPLEDEMAESAAAEIRDMFNLGATVITLGGGGLAAAADRSYRVAAPVVEVADPAGAGDTVIAALALGAASRQLDAEMLSLAASLAAAVVRHVGVAVPTEGDLAEIRRT